MFTLENQTVKEEPYIEPIREELKIEINGRTCLVQSMLSAYDDWGKRNSSLPFDDVDNFKKNYLSAIKKALVAVWEEEFNLESVIKPKKEPMIKRVVSAENENLTKAMDGVIQVFTVKLGNDEVCNVHFNLWALDILNKETLERVPYEEAAKIVDDLVESDIRAIKEILLNEWTEELKMGIIE
jgi:hypothetical protein